MRALIASGAGRYADPWHPFAETSAALAGLLSGDGFAVTVAEPDAALASLAGVDLLVVDAGDPWRGTDADAEPPEAALTGLAVALERGIGVLAVHAAVSSLRDHPAWAAAVGAIWLPGISFHPPAGPMTVEVAEGWGADVVVADEQYRRLQPVGDNEPVAWHRDERGRRHPTAWIRTHGRSRIAVDLLGHDARAYASPSHRALLSRLAHWTVGGRA